MKHYRAVVLSPHLDDAVFSCAAAIRQLRQEGPVLVINIFPRFLATSTLKHAHRPPHIEGIATQQVMRPKDPKIAELSYRLCC